MSEDNNYIYHESEDGQASIGRCFKIPLLDRGVGETCLPGNNRWLYHYYDIIRTNTKTVCTAMREFIEREPLSTYTTEESVKNTINKWIQDVNKIKKSLEKFELSDYWNKNKIKGKNIDKNTLADYMKECREKINEKVKKYGLGDDMILTTPEQQEEQEPELK